MKNKLLKDKADKSLAVKLGIGAGCVLLIAAAGWYGWKTYYYTDHLFENTKINQLDCSNLIVKEAETFIKNKVEDYTLQMEFRKDRTESISGKSIDYKYVSDGSVEKILE